MELRDVLRICFAILSLCSYGIVFVGCNEWRKVIRDLNKQEETEILKKETQDILIKGNRLIIAGIILGTIFAVIALVLLQRII